MNLNHDSVGPLVQQIMLHHPFPHPCSISVVKRQKDNPQ